MPAIKRLVDTIRLKLIAALAGHDLEVAINIMVVDGVLILNKRGLVSGCVFRGNK